MNNPEKDSVRNESPKAQPDSSESVTPSSNALGFNLDLLLDVQLEATIRFGEKQVLLRDILSMTTGSVVELDRELSDPAELLVAGRLVARGEVIVLNGNFGLRITEIASANQRAGLLQA